MRVAAIYDIHGNLPALEAAVDDIRRWGVERIVVGGDVVPGPMPREAIDFLRGLNIPVSYIHGNGDREIVAWRRGIVTGTVPARFKHVMGWVAGELRPDDEATLASWPDTLIEEWPGLGRVLFCHATPRNDLDIFTRLTPEDRLVPIFDAANADVVVCGHTHMQFDRRIGRTRVVNAGSIGMPFGEPGAYWLLIESGAQLRIEHRRTGFDFEASAARIRQTTYPEAEEFARQIIRPPAEQDMLEAYERIRI